MSNSEVELVSPTYVFMNNKQTSITSFPLIYPYDRNFPNSNDLIPEHEWVPEFIFFHTTEIPSLCLFCYVISYRTFLFRVSVSPGSMEVILLSLHFILYILFDSPPPLSFLAAPSLPPPHPPTTHGITGRRPAVLHPNWRIISNCLGVGSVMLTRSNGQGNGAPRRGVPADLHCATLFRVTLTVWPHNGDSLKFQGDKTCSLLR